MPRLAPLLASLLLAVAACDDSSTGPTTGTRLGIGDQIAIAPALGAAADQLEAADGASVGDTLLADAVRIAAQLVSARGWVGELQLTGDAAVPGSGPMHGVALALVDRTGPTPRYTHVVVAWRGLDDTTSTVRQLLVGGIVAGDAASGTFTLGSPEIEGAVRVVVTPSGGQPAVFDAAAGSLSFEEPRFGGGCPGLANGDGITCETGRETVGGQLTVGERGGTTTSSLAWSAAVLPAFRLVQR